MGKYAEYGFDQLRLIWYVCRRWDMVFSLTFRALALRRSRLYNVCIHLFTSMSVFVNATSFKVMYNFQLSHMYSFLQS